MAEKGKKCPECICSVPEYMLTYGDLMTLLLTFFVLLLSFSSVEQEKFSQMIGSLKGALGVLKSDPSSAIKSKFMPMYKPGKESENELEYKIQQVLDKVVEESRKAGVFEQVKFTQSKDRIHFRLSDDILFPSGRAELRAGNDSVFVQIGKILSLLPYEIRVEGHTDNVPIHTERYRNNWELSSARALTVAEKFISYGVDPQRFQIIGYGEYRSMASNDTPEGRKLNRRVEIFINLAEEKKPDLTGINLKE